MDSIPQSWPLYRCRNGHERTSENTYIDPSGKKECKICRRAAARKQRAQSPWRGGVSAKPTHCIYGHEYTPENTYDRTDGRRSCRTCRNAYNQKYDAERHHVNGERAKASGRTHCVRGHEYTSETTAYRPDGARRCLLCEAVLSEKHRKQVSDRFHKNVSRRGDGCWEWTAGKGAKGYGVFYPKHGKCMVAHLWLYTQIRGPVPEGLELDHRCHNPWCVNPEHLEPVTSAENKRRGREWKLSTQQAEQQTIDSFGTSVPEIGSEKT